MAVLMKMMFVSDKKVTQQNGLIKAVVIKWIHKCITIKWRRWPHSLITNAIKLYATHDGKFQLSAYGPPRRYNVCIGTTANVLFQITIINRKWSKLSYFISPLSVKYVISTFP